ncbi:MAG: hypothetical protein ACR2G7_09440 [Acidimicrobiales bacterium]
MADVEFFFDPVCPWAWLTSRWMVNVMDERPMEVDWRFISLRIVNEERDYGKEVPADHERGHTRGLELLRVAAAVRKEVDPSAVLPLYSALGHVIHEQAKPTAFDDPGELERVLRELGLPTELVAAAGGTEYDELIRAETEEALERCGGDIGTPVVSFAPPEGPSFFGPVVNRAPEGKEAVELWDAVVTLGSNPHFSELKRATRGSPELL